jgi:hypothetical protein
MTAIKILCVIDLVFKLKKCYLAKALTYSTSPPSWPKRLGTVNSSYAL